MIKQKEIPDKVIIRNATLRFDDYVFFIIALLAFYFIITNVQQAILIILFVGLIGFTTYRILKRLLDRSCKIIIDKNGITICETNNIIEWPKINYAYIEQKSEGMGRNSREFDYFHIDTKEGEILIRMSEFKYDKDLLVQAVEHFSGRNIGELSDLLNDKAKKIIGTVNNIDKISKTFTDFYKRQINLALITLCTFIGISIYLQVNINFPYVFAIGFTLMLGILYLIGILEEKRLKNQEYICELDNEKYKEYSSGFDIDISKEKKIILFIFVIFLVSVIFWTSYMISNI